MIRSSESKFNNCLYIISSPIGNLKDITYRALDVIKEIDYLFCEDTRVTSKLLSAYGINRELDSYHDHSTIQKENYIISLLEKGYNVGLISDAGTPIISDPGFELVKKATCGKTPFPGPLLIRTRCSYTSSNVSRWMKAQ